MHLALVVVPDLAARLREDGLDREQKAHLLRLEDAALRVDERDALAAGLARLDTARPRRVLSARSFRNSAFIVPFRPMCKSEISP